MRSARVRGEMLSRKAAMRGSRSSPYSTRRRSRRYPLVFFRKVGKWLMPTALMPALSRGPYSTSEARDMKPPYERPATATRPASRSGRVPIQSSKEPMSLTAPIR